MDTEGNGENLMTFSTGQWDNLARDLASRLEGFVCGWALLSNHGPALDWGGWSSEHQHGGPCSCRMKVQSCSQPSRITKVGVLCFELEAKKTRRWLCRMTVEGQHCVTARGTADTKTFPFSDFSHNSATTSGGHVRTSGHWASFGSIVPPLQGICHTDDSPRGTQSHVRKETSN